MKKFSKKLLSVVLALCVVLTTLSVAFTALADESSGSVYTVTQESPAIPMTAKTKINVADVEVVFNDTTTVNGAQLTWSSDSLSTYYEDGYIVARGIGTTKFTVTTADKSLSKNIYVVAVSASDAANKTYKFYNYDFADGLGDEWEVDTAYTSTWEKNAWTTDEQGNTILDPNRTTNNSISNYNKVVGADGQFSLYYEAADTTKYTPSAKWLDTPYFKAGVFASDVDSAKTAGLISQTVYDKAVQAGAYLPFVNAADNVPVNYFDTEGVAQVKSQETQATSYMYTKAAIFEDFTNYTSGIEVLKNGSGATWSYIGTMAYRLL